MFYTRAFADNYQRMNDAACVMATMLENEGFPSLAVPAYSPLKFYRGEASGMISFKHAATEAGIGNLGKNTIFVVDLRHHLNFLIQPIFAPGRTLRRVSLSLLLRI